MLAEGLVWVIGEVEVVLAAAREMVWAVFGRVDEMGALVIFRNRHVDDVVVEIGAGLGALAGKIWRIGLMGFASNEKNVLNCLGALDAVLSGMNAQINSGVAVKAAKQAFAK